MKVASVCFWDPTDIEAILSMALGRPSGPALEMEDGGRALNSRCLQEGKGQKTRTESVTSLTYSRDPW